MKNHNTYLFTPGKIMQKKLSLMLIVTALSSFVPAYGVRSRGGAKKRKKNKMHVIQTEQRSDDNLITVDPNAVQNNSVIIIPDNEIVTTPVVEDPLNQPDKKIIVIPGLKAVRISALDDRVIMIPDDQAHEIVTTPVAENPSTELTQTDKKVIILTGLKAFAARVSEKFHSLFS